MSAESERVSARRQLNDLVRMVEELRQDVKYLLAIAKDEPLELDNQASARRRIMDRHQQPECPNCRDTKLVLDDHGLATTCRSCCDGRRMTLAAVTDPEPPDEGAVAGALASARASLRSPSSSTDRS